VGGLLKLFSVGAVRSKPPAQVPEPANSFIIDAAISMPHNPPLPTVDATEDIEPYHGDVLVARRMDVLVLQLWNKKVHFVAYFLFHVDLSCLTAILLSGKICMKFS
jgi:hypothetical protein